MKRLWLGEAGWMGVESIQALRFNWHKVVGMLESRFRRQSIPGFRSSSGKSWVCIQRLIIVCGKQSCPVERISAKQQALLVQSNPLILHVIQTRKFYAISDIYAVPGPGYWREQGVPDNQFYALTGVYAISGVCNFRGFDCSTCCVLSVPIWSAPCSSAHSSSML